MQPARPSPSVGSALSFTKGEPEALPLQALLRICNLGCNLLGLEASRNGYKSLI